MPRIAVDVMGGDQGLKTCLEAAFAARKQDPDLQFVLVGDADQISKIAPAALIEDASTAIIHASSVVSMDDKPSTALRHKRDSSMWLALSAHSEGAVDAVCSGGNTGALMAMSMSLLGTMHGVRRPAICAAIPTSSGRAFMLDVGANVSSSADDLYQFGLMGSALAKCVMQKPAPSVALLNIGEELIKGPDSIRFAGDLLSVNREINYGGFVEGHQLFDHVADVVVADGFAGNVAIKTCEGTARFVTNGLSESYRNSLYGKLAGMLSLPILRKFHRVANPRRYNGAFLLGVNGVVLKSHGNADAEAFRQAIENAAMAARYQLVEKTAALLS